MVNFKDTQKLRTLRSAFYNVHLKDGVYRESGELAYLNHLLWNAPDALETRVMYAKLRNLDPDIRAQLAERRMDSIEYGEVPAQDLAQVEKEINLLIGPDTLSYAHKTLAKEHVVERPVMTAKIPAVECER